MSAAAGAAQSISVFGRVPPQGPKPPGVYSDTITATITATITF